jgi:hypothetical protein
MRVTFVSSLQVVCCAVLACSPIKPADPGPQPGKGTITGGIDGLALATDRGVSIARAFPPSTEVKIAIDGLTCTDTQASDRVTIDLGSSQPGTFTVVKGYPSKTSLASFQARAHACPMMIDPQQPSACHESLTAGIVVVTRVDPDVGGVVEGTFDLTFVDGQVKGTFSATRCQ